tara:strand:+ start:475 stop:1212 length:738 start_codon:yes stop_codon:yes gene_type:complete
MKDLNILNFHDRDNRIFFEEENHIYTIDKNKKAKSVTELISEFFPKFDKEYWAKKESQKTGENIKDIIKRWEDLGEKARSEGTDLHNQIENFYNKIEFKNSPELEKFMKFHEKFIVKNYEPYRTEWRVFDEKKLLAGTIDMVYKKSNNKVFLFDWKRSKKIINSNGEIEKENPFENCLHGLGHMSSSDYNKYCLQQNIYKYILEKNYDLEVTSMNLLILHPYYQSYHVVKIDELPLETDYLINSL